MDADEAGLRSHDLGHPIARDGPLVDEHVRELEHLLPVLVEQLIDLVVQLLELRLDLLAHRADDLLGGVAATAELAGRQPEERSQLVAHAIDALHVGHELGGAAEVAGDARAVVGVEEHPLTGERGERHLDVGLELGLP